VGSVGNIIKTIGNGVGKVSMQQHIIHYRLVAIWETTGDRSFMRVALSDSSNQDLIEIYEIHEKDNGDYDTYIAAKSLLQERGFTYNHEKISGKITGSEVNEIYIL